MSRYDEWDRIYRENSLDSLPWELGRPRPILMEVVEKGLVKPGRALDICCGAGTNTVYLAEKGFTVTGIDISPKAIEYAKKKAEKQGVKISFKVQNFLNLSFKAEEFDFVFDMGCFHHVEVDQRPIFVKGVHRVLKENGNYLLTCFSHKNGPGWNHFTKKELVAIFSNLFAIGKIWHAPSVEGDGVTRYFYTILMRKRK